MTSSSSQQSISLHPSYGEGSVGDLPRQVHTKLEYRYLLGRLSWAESDPIGQKRRNECLISAFGALGITHRRIGVMYRAPPFRFVLHRVLASSTIASGRWLLVVLLHADVCSSAIRADSPDAGWEVDLAGYHSTSASGWQYKAAPPSAGTTRDEIAASVASLCRGCRFSTRPQVSRWSHDAPAAPSRTMLFAGELLRLSSPAGQGLSALSVLPCKLLLGEIPNWRQMANCI
jgi:hypothetical protein